MSISVIIPAYNYAHFLPRTLRSVLGQETGDVPVEVIVVDDGSTDNTPEAVRGFDGNIHYIRQGNQGLSGARNTGMARAAGEALVFLDADDLLLPGALASQWATLRQHPSANISVCRNYMATASDAEGPLTLAGCYGLHRGSFAVHMCHANIAPVHAYMVRREVAQRAGPFDATLRACEDYDFWIRCLMAGGRMVGNAAGRVVYRKHGDSMSAQTENQVAHEALCSERVDHLLKTTPDFLPHRRLDARMAHALGAVKRARAIAPWQGDRAVDMLGRCAESVLLALGQVAAPDMAAAGGPLHVGTAEPRTAAEAIVLQYYVVRVFQFLRHFAVMKHGQLTRAHRALSRMFPQWDMPLVQGDHVVEALTAQMHEPLELESVCGEDGLLRCTI